MPWTAPQITRQNVPYVSAERQMLEAWLDFHRDTLLGKCSGLTAGQLAQRAAPPSHSIRGVLCPLSWRPLLGRLPWEGPAASRHSPPVGR